MANNKEPKKMTPWEEKEAADEAVADGVLRATRRLKKEREEAEKVGNNKPKK